MNATQAGIGMWKSPITSELITASTLNLGAPRQTAGGSLYWLEGRPSEGGRQVLVRRDGVDGAVQDVTPDAASGFNVRTRLHEYGGGEYTVIGDLLVFVNSEDQRIYTQRIAAEGAPSSPVALTEGGAGLRFADLQHDPIHSRLLCVCERHTSSDAGEQVIDSIVGVDMCTGAVTMLTSGHDFFSSPRLSPAPPQASPQPGFAPAPEPRRLAWLTWDFPAMPWDDTQLWVADVADDGSVPYPLLVSGGPGESVQQPVWDSSGRRLHFISDRSGWDNLHAWDASSREVQCVCRMDAEFGVPLWKMGISTYHVLRDGHVLAVYRDPQTCGCSYLGLIPPPSPPSDGPPPPMVPLDYGVGAWLHLSVLEAEPGTPPELPPEAALPGSCPGRISVVAIAGSSTMASKLVQLVVGSVEELRGAGPSDWVTVKRSSDVEVDPGYLSRPLTVKFPTTGGLTAFMNHYPPHNKDFSLPAGQLPPLLVRVHSGPTGAAVRAQLDLVIQYWTSQGFAVADVDYGGSSGHGRAYRERLNRAWGVVDVDDCTNAAKYLAQQGLVDPQRMCIDGGCSGGFPALACLAFRNVFSAGASLYGLTDLAGLLGGQKIESHLADNLVGPYPADKAIYEERSPIYHADGITAPVTFFHGEDDTVVPPSEAINMHAAVKARGIPTALVLFPGEQHGFRGTAAIRAALDGELYFYARVFGFPAAMPEGAPAPPLDNL